MTKLTALATSSLRLIRASTLAYIILWLPLSQAHAAPRADLWSKWEKHDSTSTKTIDHGLLDNFLKRFVVTSHPSNIYRVRYNAVTAADAEALGLYLKRMQAIAISEYNRDEQKAYWINLYNALTIHIVLSHFPVKSIRDIRISPGWFSTGPWGAKLVTVEGEKLSLDDIEHRILRPIWKDNRVHYAVNCASLGCPNLLPLAYTAENLGPLLDQGAREYVNHPRGVFFKDGKLQVSSIYVWFQEDFGGSTEGVIAHLRHFASGEKQAVLESYRGTIRHEYDWALNAP